MPAGQRIVLFDLFGVIALPQRPGALAQMAACCDAPEDAFAKAYWDMRPPYDAARRSAPEYWASVLRLLSRPADPDTIETLRLADIDSWSRVDERMAAFAQSLRTRAKVAVLSNIPRTTRTRSSRPSPGCATSTISPSPARSAPPNRIRPRSTTASPPCTAHPPTSSSSTTATTTSAQRRPSA